MYRIFALIILLFPLSVLGEDERVLYYKCVNERGTVYSDLPCKGTTTQHTVTSSDNVAEGLSTQHFKALNNVEKRQIIKKLKFELRDKKLKAAILGRDRDIAARKQQSRLSKMLNDKEKKEITKEVKKSIKEINKDYLKEVKALNKQIARLEKRIKRFE